MTVSRSGWLFLTTAVVAVAMGILAAGCTRPGPEPSAAVTNEPEAQPAPTAPPLAAVKKADAAKPAQATSLADEMRLPWSPPSAGYIRQWLVCGVFPNPPQTGGPKVGRTTAHQVGGGYDTDYLASMGGESAARPAEGAEVARPDAAPATWRKIASDDDAMDFRVLFAEQAVEQVVAYAFTTVRREQAGKAVLSLGSDDSVKVWLNGELVHDHRVGRGVQKDEDAVPVTLREGDNALLVKVENGKGGWGLVARVLSEAEAAAQAGGDARPEIAPPDPNDPDTLVVRTDVSPTGAGPGGQMVHVQAVAAGGDAVGTGAATRGTSIRFNTTGWPEGPYEVRVSHGLPDGRTVFHHLPWYKGDWRKQARELLDACDKLPERPTDPAELRLRVVGLLVADRLGGDPRKGGDPGDAAWAAIHSPLMEHREIQLGQASAVRPHGFLRLAWRDDVDDSPQYARAYLPGDYDADAAGAAKRTWPMVVVLHGYNPPNPEYIHWWGVTGRHSPLAEGHNVIVVEPHGRGNTSYNGIGDADVLRAIRAAKETFRVDPDRVYLMGYSMGGGGTWHVGTRHPELFAAIGPIYGGWDYHQRMDEAELARLTPRRRFEMESESSFAQAEALLTTPVFVNHGDADELVDVKFSRYAVRMLQRWGYELRYWEHPGLGHGRLGCEDEMMRWFLARPRVADPRRVRVRSGRLETASAHWVRVEQGEDPFQLLRAEARVVDRRTIRLDTANVLEVRLSPGEALVDRSAPVQVLWNGKLTGPHAFADGAITLRAEGYDPNGELFHKTPEIAGPIDDATTTPFAIVVGTISKDERMKRFCRLRAEAARDQWLQWQKVAPRYYLDTEIADEDIRRYTLLLFGGPADNLVTRKLSEFVALKVEPYWIAFGGQSFMAKDASFSMVCPNPYRRDRYVVVTGGNSPEGMYFANQLPGHLDFAVADAKFAEDAPFEDLCIAGGRFDKDWQFDEKYAFRGDPELRGKAIARKAPTRLTAAGQDSPLPLAELLESRSSGSFTSMRRDTSRQGTPIRLGGRTYERGIGVGVWHEPCTVSYDLTGGGWRRLKATIGIEIEDPATLEDKQKAGTRVYYVVRGDGRELYRSPTFGWDSGPVEMDVDVSGVTTLELEVANEATWFNAARSADWADLRLER